MSISVGQGAIIFPNHSKSLVSEYIGNLLGKVPRDDIFCDCYSRYVTHYEHRQASVYTYLTASYPFVRFKGHLARHSHKYARL